MRNFFKLCKECVKEIKMCAASHTEHLSLTESGEKTVLVLLCQAAEKKVPSLDIAKVVAELGKDASVYVQVENDLCENLVAIEHTLQQTRATRLVLAICQQEGETAKIQSYARKANLDPLGVQVVKLPIYCTESKSPDPTSYAVILLRSAIARSRNFVASSPENMRCEVAKRPCEFSRRALFSLPSVVYHSVPSIHPDRCEASTGCQYCVGICPTNCIKGNGTSVRIERDKCVGCGICASHCPWQAMEFPRYSHREIESQVSAILSATNSPPILLVCNKASIQKGQGWFPVEVPCAAYVTAPIILGVLSQGASVIGVLSCKECAISQQTEHSIEYCRDLLKALGDNVERVKMLRLDHGILESPLEVPPLGGCCDSSSLFGQAVFHQILQKIANLLGKNDIELEHPASPVGIVEITPNICTICESCGRVCPTQALSFTCSEGKKKLNFKPAHCIGCQACARVCPEKCLTVRQKTHLSLLRQNDQVLCEDCEIRCEVCNTPFATSAMIDKIQSRLGKNLTPFLARRCSRCRGLSFE